MPPLFHFPLRCFVLNDLKENIMDDATSALGVPHYVEEFSIIIVYYDIIVPISVYGVG